MDGVTVSELKKFVNAAGGAHGSDTWAQLVHPDVQDDLEDGDDDGNTTITNWRTCNQHALLTPLSVFQSATIISLAQVTAQTESFRKFGADEETPSGVQDESVR